MRHFREYSGVFGLRRHLWRSEVFSYLQKKQDLGNFPLTQFFGRVKFFLRKVQGVLTKNQEPHLTGSLPGFFVKVVCHII